jgi:hypothetical protein
LLFPLLFLTFLFVIPEGGSASVVVFVVAFAFANPSAAFFHSKTCQAPIPPISLISRDIRAPNNSTQSDKLDTENKQSPGTQPGFSF